MKFNKPTGIAAILLLASTAVFAADAHDDHPPAAMAAKDAQVKEPAVNAADDQAKPAVVKKTRKQARAKPKPKAPAPNMQADMQGSTDHPAPTAHVPQSTMPAHSTPNAHEGHGSKRLRVKDRNTTALMPSHAADESHAKHASDLQSSTTEKAGLDASAAQHAHEATAAKDHHAASAAPAGKDGHDAHATSAAPEAVHRHADAASEKASQASSPAEYCNPPLKSEVAALFDRWNASLRTGDPKKVAANYAPGSVLLPTVSNRARFTAAEKEDYFAHFLTRRPEGSIDDRVIDVDCNSATDAGLYTFRFADGSSVKARYSFAYRKIGSQWLITSHHSSGMPEKAELAAERPVRATAPAKSVEHAEQGSPAKGWVRYP